MLPRLVLLIALAAVATAAEEVRPDQAAPARAPHAATPALAGTSWDIAVVEGKERQPTRLTFTATAMTSDAFARWQVSRVPFTEKHPRAGTVRFDGRSIGDDGIAISGEVSGDVIIGTIEVKRAGKSELVSFSGARVGSAAAKNQ